VGALRRGYYMNGDSSFISSLVNPDATGRKRTMLADQLIETDRCSDSRRLFVD
jgi:hypothetical protein